MSTENLNAILENKAGFIYDLEIQTRELKNAIASLEGKKAGLEKDMEKYQTALETLKIEFREKKEESKKASDDAATILASAEESKKKVQEELAFERKLLAQNTAELQEKKSRLEEQEKTTNQLKRKLEAKEEELNTKDSAMKIQEQLIHSNKEMLHIKSEELSKQERSLRDRLTALESTEASFRKQEEILRSLEKNAQHARDEEAKEKAAVQALLAKNEKERVRIEKSVASARTAYELLKGVRNQLIAKGSDGAKQLIEKMLKDAFASIGIDLPAEAPPTL